MTRPVDQAMAAERPEKQTVREIWVEEVRRVKGANPDTLPHYLTLPGALGGDISALANAGVIDVTETGALANPERLELVAVERDANAIIELQRRWPGLKILTQPVQDLLRSTGMLAFPEGEHRQLFRAQIINLDLDEPLRANVEEGQLTFPVLTLVRKLAILHAHPPRVDWTLCLTLHGEVAWQADSDELACSYLCSNFSRDQTFSDQAKALLGDDLHDIIGTDPGSAAVRDRPSADQQRVLMTLVPKRIAYDAQSLGWSVDTRENLRYGGSARRAPMVTWLLRFESDGRAATDPQAVYHEGLERALSHRGHIDSAGVLHRD